MRNILKVKEITKKTGYKTEEISKLKYVNLAEYLLFQWNTLIFKVKTRENKYEIPILKEERMKIRDFNCGLAITILISVTISITIIVLVVRAIISALALKETSKQQIKTFK